MLLLHALCKIVKTINVTLKGTFFFCDPLSSFIYFAKENSVVEGYLLNFVFQENAGFWEIHFCGTDIKISKHSSKISQIGQKRTINLKKRVAMLMFKFLRMRIFFWKKLSGINFCDFLRFPKICWRNLLA